MHPCEDRPGEFNAAFWLEDEKGYSWLPGFLERHGLSPERYGFTVSVVTEEESGVVDLPAWVAPLVRQVEGGLRFSYTFLDPALEAEEAEAELPLAKQLEQVRRDLAADRFSEGLERMAALEAAGHHLPVLKVLKARAIQLLDEETKHGLEDAEAALRQALEIEPDHLPALLDLAWFQQAVEDDEETAAQTFRKAFEVAWEHLQEAMRGLVETATEPAGWDSDSYRALERLRR